MVIQINPELKDTLQTAADAAVHVANVLKINTLFYWDRLPYEIKPGDDAQAVVRYIQEKSKSVVPE